MMIQSAPAQRIEQIIRTYVEALNAADVEAVAACFLPEAVHYFPSLSKLAGAATIASFFEKRVRDQGVYWTMDELLVDADRSGAILEWTLFDRQRGHMMRGVDWFVFDPSTFGIREIRCYMAAPIRPDASVHELIDFDYAGRGYPTKLA